MRSPLTGFSMICPVWAMVLSWGIGGATKLRPPQPRVVASEADPSESGQPIRDQPQGARRVARADDAWAPGGATRAPAPARGGAPRAAPRRSPRLGRRAQPGAPRAGD